MTLIFLQIKDDMETYQMPKWSQRDDPAKSMIRGLADTAKAKAKSSNTAAAASKGKGKGKGKPINISLVKKILVK